MHLHYPTETAAGVTIGATLGFTNGIYINFKSMVLLDISWQVVGETTLLSGLGALIGLIITFYGRMFLKKIHKT